MDTKNRMNAAGALQHFSDPGHIHIYVMSQMSKMDRKHGLRILGWTFFWNMALKYRFMPCLTLQIYLFCIYCVKLRTFVIFQCVCYHFVGHFHPSCCTTLFHVALLSFSVLQFTAKTLLLQFANLLQLIVSLVCRKQGPKFWNCFSAMFPPRTILALFIGWSVGQLLFHGCNQRPQLLVKYFCWFAHSFESSWLCQEVSRISNVEMYHPFCQGLMICPLICMLHLSEFGLKNADGRMGHTTFFAVRRSGLEPNFFSKCKHAHVRQGGGIYTCSTLRSRKLSVFAVFQGVGVYTFTGTPMSHTHIHTYTHVKKSLEPFF